MKTDCTVADSIVQRVPRGFKIENPTKSMGHEQTAILARTAEKLRLPSVKNHSFSATLQTPAVDRIVVDLDEPGMLETLDANLDALIARARPPIVPGWIEVHTTLAAGVPKGFFLDRCPDGRTMVFVFVPTERARFPAPSFFFYFPESISTDTSDDELTRLTEPRYFEGTMDLDPEAERVTASQILVLFLALCGLIADGRFVATHNSASDPRSRAWSRLQMRRAQKGVPFFSFNRVKLIRPQTSIMRGDVAESHSFCGRRSHTRIGHWALYERSGEPHWTWKRSATVRGALLGFIVKERRLVISDRPFVRRGYLSPSFVGYDGQRVAARLATPDEIAQYGEEEEEYDAA
jgi:hypothetical protein